MNGKQILANIKEECIRFPLYVLSSPFKAFSDIKYEGRGSVRSCIFFLALLCITNLLNFSYSGYVVNFVNPYYVNVFASIIGIIAQSLLLMVANWSVTVLIDGCGKFREIFMVFIYAQWPMLWLTWLYIILSNFLTLEEMPLAQFCISLSYVIYVLYTFIGLIVVHGFTFTKGVASVLLTAVAVVIILFIGLLIATMASELVTFISTIYQEFMLHYA